jgi:putative addiction module component (TIGR02574 family)
MPMTLDQIIEEARRLPREQVADLVDRLTLELHQTIDPSVEEAWKQETRRRLEEIESGRVQGVPGDEVSARIRKIMGR